MKSKSSKDEKKIETVEEKEPTVLTPEEEIQKLKSEVEDYNEKFLRVVADLIISGSALIEIGNNKISG